MQEKKTFKQGDTVYAVERDISRLLAKNVSGLNVLRYEVDFVSDSDEFFIVRLERYNHQELHETSKFFKTKEEAEERIRSLGFSVNDLVMAKVSEQKYSLKEFALCIVKSVAKISMKVVNPETGKEYRCLFHDAMRIAKGETPEHKSRNKK